MGVQHASLPKGSLRLADLGFYDLGVLAALIVFRILYLLIPFSLSPIFVLIFERTELARQNKAEQARSSSGA